MQQKAFLYRNFWEWGCQESPLQGIFMAMKKKAKTSLTCINIITNFLICSPRNPFVPPIEAFSSPPPPPHC